MTTETHAPDAPRLRDHTEAAAYLRNVLAPLTERGIELPALNGAALLARAFVPNPDGTLTPRPWAGDLDQLAIALHQHEAPPGTHHHTAHPCPTWCEEAAAETGHPFTYSDPADRGLRAVRDDSPGGESNTGGEASGGLYRVHRHRAGPNLTHVAVEAWERIEHPEAASDYGTDPAAFMVSVYGPAPTLRAVPGYLTPNGARELARQLLAAADLADAERRQAERRQDADA